VGYETGLFVFAVFELLSHRAELVSDSSDTS